MTQETLLEKARRLVNEGKVKIFTDKKKYIHAEVIGDHNEYKVMIWFDDEGRPIEAKCGCAWNVLKKNPNKWCSHIRAILVFLGREKKKNNGKCDKVPARKILEI